MMTIAQFPAENFYRITTQNDWVLACILLAILGLFLVLNSFNREATVLEFFTQNPGDSPNDLASWASVSVIFWILSAVLFSQYIPFIPISVRFSCFPLMLNKMGYALASIGIVMVLKTVLTYLFYQSSGDSDRLKDFRFFMTRFYFVLCALLLAAIFVNYYLGILPVVLFKILLISAAVVFLARIILLFVYGGRILPNLWFYKILYICTLQIVPLLVVYRLLYF